jgi:hypothetical protein
VYDPIECAWERGDDCLDFFVRHYEDERAAVETRWDVTNISENANKRVEVYDIWWIDRPTDKEVSEDEKPKKVKKEHVVYNAVIAGEEFVKKPTAHPEFECNPVYVHRAGGAPTSTSVQALTERATGDIISDQWESAYTGVRETLGWMNRAITLFSLYLRNGAIGPWIYRGRKNKQIQKSVKPFKVVQIDVNEDFGPVSLPPMAAEAKEFMNVIRGEWQKAGVADIVFGDVPFTISGFGMVQLRGAVEILVSNFIHATEAAYESISNELTQQFVKLGGKKKVKVKGFDNRLKEFMTDITPQDIKKTYIVKATLREGLPKDKVQQGNAAQMWRNAGVPLQQVFEEVFEFQDGGEVARESLREQVSQLPPVMLSRAVAALVKGGNMAEAALVLQLAQASGAGIGGERENAAPGVGEEGAFPQFQPPELGAEGTEGAGVFPQSQTGRPTTEA